MRVMNEQYIKELDRYISEYHQKHRKAPSITDMAQALGMPRTTVHRYIARMKETGLVCVDEEGKVFPKLVEKIKAATISLPVLGAVSCGIPKYAEENIEEYVQVPASWFGTGQFFALRADGESMINAGINHGDLVIIRQQNYADPGQIVVALIDNEDATLKKFRPHSDGQYIDLVPENNKFKVRTVDLSYETLEIQGVAVKVLKDLE